MLLLLMGVSAASATRRGFLQVASGLIGFLLTVAVAFLGTVPLATWLDDHTALARPWTQPGAFLILWVATQLLYSGLAYLVLHRTHYRAARSDLNRWLALVPGALQGLAAGSLLLTLLTLAPLPALPRQAILDSALGSRLVQGTLALERPLEGVFGPVVRQTLGFLTVRPAPQSEETVDLKFRVAAPLVDADAEERMLSLLNAERSGRSLPPLAMDPALRELARTHATDMFQQGYFSHTGRDGRSPFARMRDDQVVYTAAGENLALAASTEFAHEGLMNSAGHRANILSPQFHRVGIGVLDGGLYGKMFVQEFTN